MKNCMHCETPNPDGWFYCKTCGNKASEPKFTTNMDKTIERAKKERSQQGRQFWEGKLKEFNKGRYA